MFLHKVYRYSKPLFVFMLLFAVGQIFINYKRGLVISPFYHYGMYSEVMGVKKSYGVFEVEVDGRKLKASNFTLQQWDKIILPLMWYSSIRTKSNVLYSNEIQRLMDKLKISTTETAYLQNCDATEFYNWYKKYLMSFVNGDIVDLNIRYRIYEFTSGRLQPTNTVIALDQLCS
jgi:hypothetical protein